MKKVLFCMMVLALMATSCKDKSKKLNYNDSDPIEMALSGSSHDFDYQINVSSDYDITYKAINPDNKTVIEVSNGKIHGKNVGTAQIKMDNGYESMTVGVDVKLFKEPSFDFGCNQASIRSEFGNPWYVIGDTIYIYGGFDPGYSYTCWRMDFVFNRDHQYYMSNVYIFGPKPPHPDFNYLLNNYFTDNFVLDSIWHHDDTTDYKVYHNIEEPQVKCLRYDNANQWGDIGLIYLKINNPEGLPRKDFNLDAEFTR